MIRFLTVSLLLATGCGKFVYETPQASPIPSPSPILVESACPWGEMATNGKSLYNPDQTLYECSGHSFEFYENGLGQFDGQSMAYSVNDCTLTLTIQGIDTLDLLQPFVGSDHRLYSFYDRPSSGGPVNRLECQFKTRL